jgi:hypothetical protein
MPLIGAGVGLQLLGLAVWIGGLLFMLAAACPLGARHGCMCAVGAMARRFHKWEVLAALAVLVGVGVLYVGDAARVPLYADAAVSVAMFLVFAAYAGAQASADAVPGKGYRALLGVNLALGLALVVILAVLVAKTSLVVVNETSGGIVGF